MKKIIIGAGVGLAMIASQSVLADGAADFAANCSACHSAATAAAVGAPGIGDKAAWKDRIAKGKDALYKVALEGSPTNPVMSAKGGMTHLSDDAVKAIVDHMIEKSK